MKCWILLLAFLLVATDTLAQRRIETRNGGYIEIEERMNEPGKLYITDVDSVGNVLNEGVVVPANLVKPVVKATTKKDQSGDYRYVYSVANRSDARVRLYSFAVETHATVADSSAPSSTWWHDSFPRLSAYDWTDVQGDPQGIIPGNEATGFLLVSPGLPSIARAYMRNYNLTKFDKGIMGGSGYLDRVVSSIHDTTRHVVRKTLGPRAIPEPFDAPAFLDTLATYPPRAEALGWITDAAVAARLESQFDEARSRLTAGEPAHVAAALTKALGTVEAQQGEVLTSEGYALLKYNLDYALEHLPEPETSTGLKVPAALTVAPFSRVNVAFSGDAFALRGRPHGLDGTPVPEGNAAPPVHGAAVADESARQTFLAGLRSFQEDNVTGSGAAPDVVQAALGFDADSLAEALSDRATETLNPGASGTYGTAEAPVVAYAPHGLPVSGTLTGHGILVVDGTLTASGTLRWTGLVIHRSAPRAGATLSVSGTLEVIGGLVLTGEASSFPALVQSSNALTVTYSPAALELAAPLLEQE